MLTDISEVSIVLGLAALINWDIDLPSMAGIIAAVGTGVNDQIILTDEVLSGKKEAKKFFSLGEQVRKAFSIIFTAAATIIAAMLPILSIGAGMLKGFAFTTIMGVLVGIIITRPGYARVIEYVLREKE
jgi:preprotein translocase subunit SecD